MYMYVVGYSALLWVYFNRYYYALTSLYVWYVHVYSTLVQYSYFRLTERSAAAAEGEELNLHNSYIVHIHFCARYYYHCSSTRCSSALVALALSLP